MSFQNNKLLNNHYGQRNNTNQLRQMQRMKEQQAQLRQQALHNFNQQFDQNKGFIKDKIIKPTTNKIDNVERMAIRKKMKDLEKEYTKNDKQHLHQLKNLWKKRTNQPYKNIIKDKQHIDKFLTSNTKKLKHVKKEDLVVHRVTKADKIGVTKDYNKFQKGLETHNNELKTIYSLTNQISHKKKFEYNHKSKFRIKYKPSDHDKLKTDKLTQYKKEQTNIENGKKEIENIMNAIKKTPPTKLTRKSANGVTVIRKRNTTTTTTTTTKRTNRQERLAKQQKTTKAKPTKRIIKATRRKITKKK